MGLSLFEIKEGDPYNGELITSKVGMYDKVGRNSCYTLSSYFLSCDKRFKSSIAKQLLYSTYRNLLPEDILYDLLDIAIPNTNYFNLSVFQINNTLLPILDIDRIQEFVSSLVDNPYYLGIRNNNNYVGSKWSVYRFESDELVYNANVFLRLKIIKEFSNIRIEV